MTLLKQDAAARQHVKDRFATAVSHLDDVDPRKAKNFANWIQEKAKLFKEQYTYARYPKLPDNIQVGDIILVNFGINVGEEMSDDGTNGHFAIVWGQQSKTLIVIPISSRPSRFGNPYMVNLGVIPNLPQTTDTYAKFDMMRPVSLRRVRRMREQPTGKVTITDPAVLQKIRDSFQKLFVEAGKQATVSPT